MTNLFKSYEVAERFGIPKPTAANWAKDRTTWRRKLYAELERVYANELAEIANKLKGK